jgi:hypothetical protein
MQLADRSASGRSVAFGNPSGGAHALEISYLTGCDDALVTHRYTTTESFHKNMLADRAVEKPDRRSLARVAWLTPGLP